MTEDVVALKRYHSAPITGLLARILLVRFERSVGPLAVQRKYVYQIHEAVLYQGNQMEASMGGKDSLTINQADYTFAHRTNLKINVRLLLILRVKGICGSPTVAKTIKQSSRAILSPLVFRNFTIRRKPVASKISGMGTI